MLVTAAPIAGGTGHWRAPDEPGNRVDIRMMGGRFVPGAVEVAPGTVVTFRLISGGPHNAAFWPDSLPATARAALAAGMTDTIGPLMGPLLVIEDETWSVTMPRVPGEYRYYCLPHLAGGMTGRITVRSP